MLPGEAEFNAEQAAKAPVRVTYNGQTGTVPADQIDAAKAAGAQVEEAPDDTLGALKAAEIHAGSALLGGAIPGAIHATAKAISPEWAAGWKENYEAAVKESERSHPVASGLGTGLGMAIDQLGPIGKVSSYLGAGAKGLAGGAALGRIAEGAVSAAAAQSAYNVGHQASEDELGDVDSNAEKLFAAATNKDVLFAGLAGGALTGVGEAWKAGKGLLQARMGTPSAASLDAATGVLGAGKLVERDAALVDADVELLRKTGMTQDAAREAVAGQRAAAAEAAADKTGAGSSLLGWNAKRAAGGDAERLRILQAAGDHHLTSVVQRDLHLQQLAQDIKTPANELLEGMSHVNDAAFSLRRQVIEKAVDPALYDTARDVSATLLTDAKQAFADLKPFAAVSKPAQGRLAAFEKAVAAAEATDSVAARRAAMTNLHVEGNLLKRELDGMAKLGGERYAVLKGGNQGGGIADRFRDALADSSVFGKAGDLQRDVNGAFSGGKLAADAAMSKLGGTPLAPDAVNAYRGQAILDPGKIESLLRKVGTNEGENASQALHGMINQAESMAKAASQVEGLTPKQLKAIETVTKNAGILRQKVADATVQANVINKLNTQLALENETHGLPVLGHGMVGGIIGKASEAFSKPATFQRTLANVAQSVDKVDRLLRGAAAAVTTGAKGAGKVASSSMNRDTAENAIASVKALSGNPDLMSSRGEAFVGKGLSDAAPKHTAALASLTTNAVRYLASVAPSGRMTNGLIPRDDQKPRYSDQELHRFTAASEAVKDPMTVLAQASKGQLSREGLHAVQNVYPRLFQQLQGHVQDQLYKMQEDGSLARMPYQRRELLATLLQIPGDGTNDKAFISRIQAEKAQSTQQQGGPGQQNPLHSRNVNLNPTAYQTEADQLSQPR